jgi:hypothetical protein
MHLAEKDTRHKSKQSAITHTDQYLLASNLIKDIMTHTINTNDSTKQPIISIKYIQKSVNIRIHPRTLMKALHFQKHSLTHIYSGL